MSSTTKTILWIVGGVAGGLLLAAIVALLALLWFGKSMVELFTMPDQNAAKAAFAAAADTTPPNGYLSLDGYVTPCTAITIDCVEIGGNIKYEANSEQAQNATPEEACATFADYVATNSAELQVSLPTDLYDTCITKFTPDGRYTFTGEVQSPAITQGTEADAQGNTLPDKTPTATYTLAHHFRYPSNWVITIAYS